MAETIDEITINWEDEEGNLAVKELKKEVLTRGAWTTIMFLLQNLDKKTGDYKAPQVRIVRYKKSGGRYLPQSKFTISSAKQARQITGILTGWLPEMGEGEGE
jgi:hypothetical protein